MPGVREYVRTTCPRDCYDACGIIAIKRSGVITKLLGDPDHPVSRGALCGKCALAYNGVFRDPDSQLATPLKRIGPKGEGGFETIGWDEAMATIADRLSGIVASSGAETILNTHYTGTCSLIAGHFPDRFFNRLGATEVDLDTICNAAGHVALDYILGSSTVGFDPRTAKDAACIMVWGANPSASAPHAHKHWLGESPARVIVIDPLRTPTAEAADLHLQPFPGSDAALAFALLHVLRRERLIDRDFIAAHTFGWGEVEATVEACDPPWGEAATGVPAALIERAARIYGAGPSLRGSARGCSVSMAAATSSAPAPCCRRSPAISPSPAPGFTISTAAPCAGSMVIIWRRRGCARARRSRSATWTSPLASRIARCPAPCCRGT